MTIAIVCVAWVLRTFDWTAVMFALARIRLGVFLGLGPLVLAAILLVRSLRWLALLDLAPTTGRVVQSFLVNAVSTGLATVTPFQVGELVKAKLVPREQGMNFSLGVSAILLERVLDLCSLLAIGAAGFSMQRGYAMAAWLLCAAPLVVGLAIAFVGPWLGERLPDKLKPYLQVLRSPRIVWRATLLTIPVWVLYGALWWVTAYSIDVAMTVEQTAMLLGAVMLAIVATMAPSGLGVSELASRSVLVWSGMSAQEAEGVAIALRLLTPLITVVGLLCALPLWRKHKGSADTKKQK